MRRFLLLLLGISAFQLFSFQLFGAFTEFYVQTTGSNLNGGSDSNNAAAYTSTNGNWSTTTNVFTPISGNPSSSGVVVGQMASVYIDAATLPVYYARVTAVSSTTITLSSTAIAGTAPVTSTTARTIKCGGAWQGPNGASALPFGLIAGTLTDSAGDPPRVNFKGGTNYAITAIMTHAIAGPVVFEGYTTTVGDGGRATIDGGTSGASYKLLSLTGTLNLVRNIIFQNNGATGSVDGVEDSTAANVFERCVVNNTRGNGFYGNFGGVQYIECEAYSCNKSNTAGKGGFASPATAAWIRCISHDNSGTANNGFVTSANYQLLEDCVADTNGQHGLFITGATQAVTVKNCSFYSNTGDGIHTDATAAHKLAADNNLFISNAWGISMASSTSGVAMLHNNAYYNNSSGTSTFPVAVASAEVGAITLTAVPFVDAPNGDFRINLAAAKGVGRGTFLQTAASYAGALGYPDVGAVQHQDAGGTSISRTGRGTR